MHERRLVLNADAERRAIERLLHDGVQQDLVGIAVKLQLARRLSHDDPVAAHALLDELETDVRSSLERIRTVTDTVYPSVLQTRGLAEAVRGVAAAAGVSIGVEAKKLRRYPAELEGAVYFACRDALEAAVARGPQPAIHLWEEKGSLCFEVGSEGRAMVSDDADVTRIRDRVDALGGRLELVGPRLSASIPV